MLGVYMVMRHGGIITVSDFLHPTMANHQCKKLKKQAYKLRNIKQTKKAQKVAIIMFIITHWQSTTCQ